MTGQPFGDWLRLRMDRLQIAPADLARDLSVPYLAVVQWRRGIGLPDPRLLSRLAVALNVPLDELRDALDDQDQTSR